MKSIYFKTIIAAVFILFAGYSVYTSKKDVHAFTELTLANIDALADGETDYYNCWYYGCQFDFRYNCLVYDYGGYYIMTCPGYRA